MLPSPRLFRSRWAALLWAAGICWSAIQIAGVGGGSAPAPGNDANGADDTARAVQALNGVF